MAENIVEKFEKLFKGKYKIYYSSIRKLEKSFFHDKGSKAKIFDFNSQKGNM